MTFSVASRVAVCCCWNCWIRLWTESTESQHTSSSSCFCSSSIHDHSWKRRRRMFPSDLLTLKTLKVHAFEVRHVCICASVCAFHLLGVCVEGDGHVQQQLPVFHSADKVLNANFQVSGCLVDLLWVALSSLSQLLRRLQQLVCVSVRVLQEKHTQKKKQNTTRCLYAQVNTST